jgi:hypothetical protein
VIAVEFLDRYRVPTSLGGIRKVKKLSRLAALAVAIVGVVSIVAGAVFVGLAIDKYQFLKSALEEEQITLGIDDSQLAKGEVVDTMEETQVAGDIVRSHRHEIAPTYGDLLGGERYDPTNPEQLSYAQAMNIENYLYLATNSFGVSYLTMGMGAALVIIGLALMSVALVLNAWAKRLYEEAGKPAKAKTS